MKAGESRTRGGQGGRRRQEEVAEREGGLDGDDKWVALAESNTGPVRLFRGGPQDDPALQLLQIETTAAMRHARPALSEMHARRRCYLARRALLCEELTAGDARVLLPQCSSFLIFLG